MLPLPLFIWRHIFEEKEQQTQASPAREGHQAAEHYQAALYSC